MTVMNDKNHTVGIRLPSEFHEIEKTLNAIRSQFKELQPKLPKLPLETPQELDAVRREALKASIELDGLKSKFNDTLALEFVDLHTQEKLGYVKETRKIVANQYLEADEILKEIRTFIKHCAGKVSAELMEELKHVEQSIKKTVRRIHAQIMSLPELGMTFDEWDSLKPTVRRSLRSPGRPSAPLEAAIIQTNRHLMDCVALANRLSNGSIRTIDEAIAGVSLTNRGRPPVSALGKMDRKLNNLIKRLEEVASTPSKMQATKKNRLMAQINELREHILEQEAELDDLQMTKRELEKLRASHRDMVVSEVTATGEDQAALLMAIIRNEDSQLSVIEKLLQLEPDARVTVTHKVNPKETRNRFERLRLRCNLNQSELDELDRHERRQDRFTYSRNR